MKAQHSYKFLAFCVLLQIPQVHSTNIHLQVNGLSGDLQRNVHMHLSTINNCETTADITYFQRRVENVIRKGLCALGYYSPTINFTFQSLVNSKHNLLIVNITPGRPIKIAGINIILRGEAQRDNDYLQLIKNSKPAINSILNHKDYDKFKIDLSNLNLRKGYFDAVFHKSQLRIAKSSYQAYWYIDFDSGQRYHFGKVYFHGSQIYKGYLQNFSKICEGNPYNYESIAELNRLMMATNWFNSVTILPNFSADKKSKILSLDVIIKPHNSNNIEAGIGYNTEIGSRVKATWNKPWLNANGHSLQTSFNLSISEKMMNISYKIPLLKNPLEQYYLLRSNFKQENINDILSSFTTLSIARYWNLSNSWQRIINLYWSLDDNTQINVNNTNMLIYPGISISRKRQKGGLIPVWGDSQCYSINISNTIWGSSINFIIWKATNTWIRTLAEKNRFIIRSNISCIKTRNFTYIPPSLRFFAGEDYSIRGYKHKSLPSHNNYDRVNGASKIIISSLEYQYNITDKWWGAIFIDSGEAVNDFKKNSFKTGVGIGIHWQSPVGPIKFDVAAPITNKHNHNIQFYIGLGSEL